MTASLPRLALRRRSAPHDGERSLAGRARVRPTDRPLPPERRLPRDVVALHGKTVVPKLVLSREYVLRELCGRLTGIERFRARATAPRTPPTTGRGRIPRRMR